MNEYIKMNDTPVYNYQNDIIKELNKELAKFRPFKSAYEMKKEIERLKKREQECIDHYLVQCKYASEMEAKYITANNIINELEKYLIEQVEKSYSNDYDNVLDKLDELKGSDKE